MMPIRIFQVSTMGDSLLGQPNIWASFVRARHKVINPGSRRVHHARISVRRYRAVISGMSQRDGIDRSKHLADVDTYLSMSIPRSPGAGKAS